MDAHEENLTNADADAQVESALLQRLLDLHPTRVTATELVRDLEGQDPDFAARDRVERAIRELAGAGLVHQGEDGLVTPTRAALRFGEILGA